MRVKLILSVFLFLLFTGIYGQDPYALTAKFPLDSNVRTGTLPNGMKYYVLKNAKPENRAELRLAVNVGSTMENEDQRGLAHFVEHMCFNGTRNFKKSELVDYLESIGTKFGPHLNAYTSFDETVYMLQVPTDSSEIMKKALQILEDWAHNVSFEDEEIDKERGVVMEEWRLGLGADQRMSEKYFPIILENSRYAMRLPIGSPDVIMKAPYETLKKFYNDFYRPDLMAVIAVGDFDPEKMEKMIVDQFSKIPKKAGPPVREWFIPDNYEPKVAIVSDRENPYTQVQIIYKHDPVKQETVADFRQGLVNSLFENMLNARLQELTQKADAPFVYGGCGYGSFLRPKDAYYAYAMVPENGIDKGIEALMVENSRVRKYGFTKSELARAKDEMLRGYEKSYTEREKTPSANRIGELVRNFLENEPAPGIAFEYEACKRYLDDITLEEVNKLPSKWITQGNNMLVIIMSPEKEGLVLPTEEMVVRMIREAQEKEITEYVDDVAEGPLMKEKPQPGKITAEKELKEVGATEYTLSNGVKVILKTTDFKNDEVLFSSSGQGGISLFSVEDHQSADYSNLAVIQGGVGDISNVQLDKMMKGKIARVYPYVSNYSQGFSGSCSPADLETAMQLIYMYATHPRKDKEAFEAMMDQQKAIEKNRTSDPDEVFSDTVQVTMASHHPRMKPSSIEELNKVNLDRGFEIYNSYFNTFNGHTFVFVGNVDAATFKPLAEQYLGALPGKEKAKKWKDMGVKAPKGKVTKVVKKGVEPKSRVMLQTHGKFEWTLKNRIEFNALINVLSIKLRENLREDKGGVYGVGVYGSPRKIPNSTYSITVQFGCAPENVDTLINNVMLEIDKLIKNGPEEKDLKKVKETMKREHETDLKENRFWQSVISTYVQNGEKWSDFPKYDSIVDGITAETLKKLAKQYLAMDNLAKFILMPEN